jgi:5-methylcytosine-specific restriction endonuclease McrA
MKICSKCKVEKPVTEFHKKSGTKDGLQLVCKNCVSQYDLFYRLVNKEKESTRYRLRYAADSENKKNLQKAYYKENPEKYAAHNRSRRARKKNAEGNHTIDDIRLIFYNQRGFCANCKAKLLKTGKQKYHVDHIIPLSRGGSDWPINLQCLCQSCNLRKSAKDPFEWAKEQGKLL